MTLPSWADINKSIAIKTDWKDIEEDYEKGLYKKPIGGAFNIRPYSFEEDKFQKAYREMAIKQRISLDPDHPEHQYDWRALYKEDPTLTPDPEGHFPSKYKKLEHKRRVIEGVDTVTGEPAVPPKERIGLPVGPTSEPFPQLDEMKVQENNIKSMEKAYTGFSSSLDTDYKQYEDLGKQLDETEATMAEAAPEMQFSLNQKRNGIAEEYNALVDKLKLETKKHQTLYTQLETEVKSFNMNINAYNQYILKEAADSFTVDYIPEGDFKDNFDAFRLGFADLFHKGKQYFTAALPNLIYADIKFEDQKYYKIQGQPGLTEEQVKKVNEVNKGRREEAKKIYLRAEERYDKWLVDNPELVPRPEWSGGVIENVKKDPSILLDSAYWGYEAAQSASFMLAVMGTTLGVTAVTGNPFLGMAAGVVVATPSQSQDVWDELVANGATEEQASKIAVPLGLAIASVEVLGDLPLLAAVSKPFKKLLFKGIKTEIIKRTALSIAKSGVKTFFAVEGAEIMEENIQGAMQDAAVNMFRENVSLLEKIPETTVKTFMATAPWALFGGGANVRSNINERLRVQIIENNLKIAVETLKPVEILERPKPPVERPKVLYRADVEGKVRISSVDEPFLYLAEDEKTADRFAHGGDQGRPGAKTRAYDVDLNIYDNEKAELLDEEGKITFEQLRDNKDDIVDKLNEADYDAIYIYELNGDRTIAVLETGLEKVTPKVEPKAPEVPTVITDPVEVQKIKESITEGELILKTGKSNNRKLSAEELTMVQRSVDSAKRKIGLETPVPKVEPKEPTVPEGLTELTEETKKYESAEDFVYAKRTEAFDLVKKDRDIKIDKIQEQIDEIAKRNTRDVSPKTGISLSNQEEKLQEKQRKIKLDTDWQQDYLIDKKLKELYGEINLTDFYNQAKKVEPIPKAEPKKPVPEFQQHNPMMYTDPVALGRDLESYPTDPGLLARQAELIFEQHFEVNKDKKKDYPISYGEQDLKAAITNLKEDFGGAENYPLAQRAIDRAEKALDQLPVVGKVKPEVPKVEPKAPWQMTRKEYFEAGIEIPGHPHIDRVREALQEGKPVPTEVLADYPDLKPYKKETPEVTPEETTPTDLPPKTAVSEPETIKALEEEAVRLGKPSWEKMTRKEIITLLDEIRVFKDPEGKLIKKLGNIRIDLWKDDNYSLFVGGAEKEHVITNSHWLFIDRTVADKIIAEQKKKIIEKDIKHYMETMGKAEGFDHAEAVRMANEGWDKMETGEYPDWKRIIDDTKKVKDKSKVYTQGQVPGPLGVGATTVMSNGITQVYISTDYVALMEKRFPDGIWQLADSDLKPVSMVVNNKIAAIVMPIRRDEDSPRPFDVWDIPGGVKPTVEEIARKEKDLAEEKRVKEEEGAFLKRPVKKQETLIPGMEEPEVEVTEYRAIPKVLEPLAEEARKYESAEEFIDSLPKTKNKNFGDSIEIEVKLPVSEYLYGYDADKVEKITKRRKVTEPVIATVEGIGSEYIEIIDGNNRLAQAIFNNDETIPAKLIIPKDIITDVYDQATTKPKEEEQELSARQWGQVMEKEAVGKETISKTNIMSWAEEAFGFPIKGKATHRWKAAGVFYGQKQIIRMAKWGELAVAAHEIAHGIDQQIAKKLFNKWKWGKLKGITGEFAKELADLDYDQNQRRTSEGFAEYMRYELTQGIGKEKAPGFHKYFNESILPQFPEIKKNIDTFRAKLDIWNKQGAENRIIQHIDWKGEQTETRGLMPKLRKALEWVNIRFNDEFYLPQKIVKGIEKIIGKEIRPSKNPAILMEYSKAKSGAIARTFVMDKAIDEHGNVVGDSLLEILKPIPNKEMSQFIAYSVSLRALQLSARDIESGFDIDDAKFIVEKYKDKDWKPVAREVTKWSNHMLDWVVRAGGLSEEVAKLMRDLNPIYLPFKRAFLEEVSVMKGVGGYVDTGKAVKAIKGSGRPIINPLESIITQTRELIAKAQKIRIAKAFIDLADEHGVGGFITKVPAPMRATTFSANQIKSYLDEIATGEEGMIGSGQYNDLLTVFTQDFKYSGKENIVTIWKDGKQEFYEIHPDLYEAFKGVDPLKLGPITKVFAPYARMLRLGATGCKLSFGLARNPFRDAFSYVVFSKRNNTTVFDPIKGFYKDVFTKEGEATWRFKKLGGGLSGQIGLDRASVQNSYDEMLELKLGKLGKALHIVKHPINALSDLVSITEMGPRSAEIEASYKKYISEKWQKNHPDWTEEDAFIQAFIDAQDVTVNFTKSGKWAKQINQVTAFFNVSIRGPEKLYRGIKERPIQTFVKGTLWLTTIAVASWYRNKDKDWYKNLPSAYKYNNLFFEIGGNVYRLPIPFELGIIFMAAPQAALDTMKDQDTKALKGLLDLAQAQIPDPMPSVFQPAYNVARNKNYLGVPIESEGMQYLYPTERKRDYTTKAAIALSKGMDKIGIQLSPIQLDYMLDSYSGGFLRQFRITGEELSDLPVIGDLMLRDPSYPKRQLNEYFTDWEYLRQRKQSGIATRAEIRELNRIDGFYKTYKTLQGNITKAKKANNQILVEKYSNIMRERLERYGYK